MDGEEGDEGSEMNVMVACGMTIPFEIQMLILDSLLSRFGLHRFYPEDRWIEWARVRRVSKGWKEMADEVVYFPNDYASLSQPLNFTLYIRDKETRLASFRCILKNKSSKPESNGLWAVIKSAEFKYVDILEILLKDPRVNSYREWSQELMDVFHTAIDDGCEKVALMLLEDGRIHQVELEYELERSCRDGRTEIVKAILDKTVTPIKDSMFCIMESVRRKHTDIVLLLLNDRKFKINSYQYNLVAMKRYTVIEMALEKWKRENLEAV